MLLHVDGVEARSLVVGPCRYSLSKQIRSDLILSNQHNIFPKGNSESKEEHNIGRQDSIWPLLEYTTIELHKTVLGASIDRPATSSPASGDDRTSASCSRKKRGSAKSLKSVLCSIYQLLRSFVVNNVVKSVV
jgi:hypothetical protein